MIGRLEMSQNVKKGWKVIYKGALVEFDNAESISYWSKRTASEKFSEVDRLIDHVLRMRGMTRKDGSELLRSTAVIKCF